MDETGSAFGTDDLELHESRTAQSIQVVAY
jgi:hypothetical protein